MQVSSINKFNSINFEGHFAKNAGTQIALRHMAEIRPEETFKGIKMMEHTLNNDVISLTLNKAKNSLAVINITKPQFSFIIKDFDAEFDLLSEILDTKTEIYDSIFGNEPIVFNEKKFNRDMNKLYKIPKIAEYKKKLTEYTHDIQRNFNNWDPWDGELFDAYENAAKDYVIPMINKLFPITYS